MVYFIDYEYARCNHPAYDIGNHFNEHAGSCFMAYLSVRASFLSGVDQVDYSLYPTKLFQFEFLRHYLATKNSRVDIISQLLQYMLLDTSTEAVNETEIEELYRLVNKFALVWDCLCEKTFV